MGKLADHILIDAEENIQSVGLDGSAIDIATRSVYGSACPGGRVCVPMSDCSAMHFEAGKACFAGDRSMFCGGTQYEPYICCPKNPLEQNRVCGKSLVAGQFYKGLGAFPFVARIGFKSKWRCEVSEAKHPVTSERWNSKEKNLRVRAPRSSYSSRTRVLFLSFSCLHFYINRLSERFMIVLNFTSTLAVL